MTPEHRQLNDRTIAMLPAAIPIQPNRSFLSMMKPSVVTNDKALERCIIPIFILGRKRYFNYAA
jgi:hypothetical protein